MELRQLRCLIAVAETKHFGRAAQNLGMLPASLGRHIKLLEESLGGQLLIRTTRHVELTDAGRAFVVQARELIDDADRMEHDFREGANGKGSLLRIGTIDSAAAGLMPCLLPKFRESHPAIDVELLEQKTIRLLPRILSGRLDLAIVRPPDAPDRRLEFLPLFCETAVVAMPTEHALAKRRSLSVEDIADEPLIVPDRRSRPHSHDLTIKLFVEAGHTARIAQIAEEKQTIVSLVSTGVGLAIVPKWASRLAVGGVSFVPLDRGTGSAEERLALATVWLKGTRHQARDAFLQVLQQNVSELSETA